MCTFRSKIKKDRIPAGNIILQKPINCCAIWQAQSFWHEKKHKADKTSCYPVLRHQKTWVFCVIIQKYWSVCLCLSVCPVWSTTSGSKRSVSWRFLIIQQEDIIFSAHTCLIHWTSACLERPSSRTWQSPRWKAKSCARLYSNGCRGKFSKSRHPYITCVSFNSHNPVL